MQAVKPLINPNFSPETQAMMQNLVLGYIRLMGLTSKTIKDIENDLVLRNQFNTWLAATDSEVIAKLSCSGASVDPALKLIRTKLASYEKIKQGAGQTIKDTVYSVISKLGPISRNDIAKSADLRINSCTARVNELLKEGLIEVIGYGYDEETDRNVELLVITTESVELATNDICTNTEKAE